MLIKKECIYSVSSLIPEVYTGMCIAEGEIFFFIIFNITCLCFKKIKIDPTK